MTASDYITACGFTDEEMREDLHQYLTDAVDTRIKYAREVAIQEWASDIWCNQPAEEIEGITAEDFAAYAKGLAT